MDEGFVDRKGLPVKFRTTIGIAAAINRAYRENKLVLEFDPSHRVSAQYRELASEVESRIAAHRATRAVASEVELRKEAPAQYEGDTAQHG